MLTGHPLAFFQPFIDTATGQIAGIEALGRLRQADGSYRSVGPLFASRKVSSLDLRQLDRDIRDNALSRFREAPPDWFLSLNISPRWISRAPADQPLPSLRQVERYGIDPRRIVFEITELTGNQQRLLEVVRRYRAAGARVAIDDFGAGYSQLDRIMDLAPDILKLDMRLFQAAVRGGPSSEVVKAMALMAEKTGCRIIAEGVETEEELEFALECGARYVQGFLFAQASEQFQQADAYLERFAALRTRYVQHKLQERSRLMELRQQLSRFIQDVRSWAEGHSMISALPLPHDLPWLLRLYQCDRHGTQITPNLEWNGMFWQENRRYLNHNWSWRPYFYSLLAEGMDERRLNLSTIYRDATSNQYCITAGQFIAQGQRPLLIDIDASFLTES
ncbi:signal transduction protein [Pseudomonas asuensis]|uniref:Signal transduction protein n=1 Tax=Pseudomonas asuensis TaxID=1825787 RepID=A0ABQ2GQB8_9PSED|nr:EAL domain-containing protein [Pseudomonas asuensis]GGM06690.1 signal transduction protein [Pseudomonas asuensis]